MSSHVDESNDAVSPAGVVSLERRGKVAIVSIDRPKVNALSIHLVGQLAEVLEEMMLDPPGAVVLWGGERIFAAGADIDELADPSRRETLITALARAFDAIAALPRATIAAVRGLALGGGCELALACDLRVVASDARLGLPEVLLGIFPGAGGTQRLTRLVGSGRAKEMIFTGRPVSADEALAIGLVERVVEPAFVLDTALELAEELARGAVVAHGLAKQAIDRGTDLPLSAGLALERELFMRVLETNDARRGIESFLAHGPGKAMFTGY
jgi:enoyl-CoA hydratase